MEHTHTITTHKFGNILAQNFIRLFANTLEMYLKAAKLELIWNVLKSTVSVF